MADSQDNASLKAHKNQVDTFGPGKMKEILFKGQPYLFLEDGPITTPDNYANFGVSFAHYYPNADTISRYGEKIGTSADIQVVGEVDDPGAGSVSLTLMNDEAWFSKPKYVTQATELAAMSRNATTDAANPPPNLTQKGEH